MVPLDVVTCPCRVCLICEHVGLGVCQCQAKVHDVDESFLLALSNEKILSMLCVFVRYFNNNVIISCSLLIYLTFCQFTIMII